MMYKKATMQLVGTPAQFWQLPRFLEVTPGIDWLDVPDIERGGNHRWQVISRPSSTHMIAKYIGRRVRNASREWVLA